MLLKDSVGGVGQYRGLTQQNKLQTAIGTSEERKLLTPPGTSQSEYLGFCTRLQEDVFPCYKQPSKATVGPRFPLKSPNNTPDGSFVKAAAAARRSQSSPS